MKVTDPHFTLEKVRKYLDEDIFPSRRRVVQPIPNWKFTESHMDDRVNDAYTVGYDDSGWQEVTIPTAWGGYDMVAWFRATVPHSDTWHTDENTQIALRLLPGPRDGGDSTAEGLLYVNGKPVQAVDIWHEEAFLPPELLNSDMHLALKVWSGVLGVPPKRRFMLADIVLVDMRADAFFYAADTALKCALELPEGDLRRIRITAALNKAFAAVCFLNMGSEEYYASLADANDVLAAEMAKLAECREIKPSVAGVGHSHIDMAWLWRLSATREKASRTFATVLNLMRQYPEYKFMHSSPQLYKFLEQDHPEIFAAVKEKIEQGQWEITGGMWVEPDTNIPAGESLVRQFLYGTRYIRDTFGKETTLAWLPDVFGYSAAMPQIMKKSGMKYFMTTKISWNQYNHFPYDTFKWRGLDGSEVLTHFITTPEDGSWYYTYNGQITPEEVVGLWRNYKDKEKNDDLLIAYGWGDGGGGPTREQVVGALHMENVPGIPNVRLDHAEPYFARLLENTKDKALSTWEGELYFEYHRGTYTSQSHVKKDNREAEFLLHDLETLYSAGDILAGGDAFPQKELAEIWERVLLNQFHDILPGSSIREVYEDTRADYKAIREKGAVLRDRAEKGLAKLVSSTNDAALVYNTSGFTRDEQVFIPYGEKIKPGTGFADENGVLPTQPCEGGVLVSVSDVPSYGWKTLQLMVADEAPSSPLAVSKESIDTPYYAIKLNENGEIVSLFDKRLGRELATGPMNKFVAYEDKPQRFDAWDIDIYYREKPYPAFRLIEAEVVECGALRAVLKLVYRFNKSTVTQRLTVYANNPRIDFVTHADWQEEQVLWKTYFPTCVHSDRASYEIQFGNLQRPAHTNTEYDFAQFEVCGHKWADLSEDGFGVALLNNCKYGHDIHDGTLALTLVKSATRPDETADRCEHDFTYALLPHEGGWKDGDVQRQALALNSPLCTLELEAAGADKNASFSLFSVEGDHVILDTVKRAEDERAYIVRLYEYKNRSEQAVTLKSGAAIVKAVETDLMENEIGSADFTANSLTFPIGAYEIKTFKLYF